MPSYLVALKPVPDRKLARADFAPVEAEDLCAAGRAFVEQLRAVAGGPGPWAVLVGRDVPANRWPDGKPIVVEQVTYSLSPKGTDAP